jgi:hypothetical protein
MAEQNMQNSSSGKTQSFNKGMNKDNTDIYMSEGLWYNAINAINNSHYGESGSIGNEPSNRFCTAAPFTIIGYAYIKDTEWLIYSTDNVSSEIGIFNESNCSYSVVVNADCLNFKTTHLITAFVKENYDCTFSAYWQDNLNPDRTMNINDVPYICVPVSDTDPCLGDDCTNQLDCDQIRLHPLIKQPCVSIRKAIGSGQLNNGSYMATIAYSENGIRLTEYAIPSVPQGLWRDSGQGGSIEIELTDLDTKFDEYELVIVSVVTQQAIAKKIGYYNINQKKVTLDIIQGSLETVPLSYIPLRSVVYDRSEKMAAVNGYLIRSGVSTQPYVNYQKQANKIKTNWVAVEYDVNFYWNGGNHVGYMRDEVYSYFIRWIYNTGNRTASYHIPGREAIASDLVNVATSDDVVTPTETLAWQVYDTSTYAPASGSEKDGGIVIARGNMAYWESIERYPADPIVWGDLCYQPIRHHKMPSNETTHIHNQGGNKIVILGVEFSNIEQPVDENCNPLSEIVGYEILRGSREGNKSIVTKGIFANMVEFNISGAVGNRKGLFENYPYNDLRPDPFLSDDYTILDNNDNEEPWENASKLNKYKQNYLAFHSPEIHFERPAFGTNYIKIYTEEKGTSTGKYEIPLQHPRFKLLTDNAFALSIAVGLGIALIEAIGKSTLKGGNFPLVLGTGGLYADASRDSAPVTSVADLISGGILSAVSIGGQANAIGTVAGIIQFIVQLSFWIPRGMSVVLDLIRNMANYRNYLLQYNSYGFYSNYTNVNNTTMPSGYPKAFRRIIEPNKIKYIGMHIQDFDNSYRINNLYRTKFVCLKLTKNLPNPVSIDNSKKRVKDIVGLNTISYKDPFGEFTSSICQYYGAIKVDYQNQYGQLYGIVQLPTDSCVYETLPLAGITYQTSAIFGGDVYINRYTEKNPYFFFNTWMIGELDGTEYDYRNYVNGPAPRYWANYANFDSSDFAITFSWDFPSELLPDIDFTTPSDFYRLDAPGNNGATARFVRKNNWFYLFYNGVRDYFTESELNMAYRDYGLEDFQKFYDVYGLSFNDISTMFRSDIIKQPTYYKYDLSLSSSKLFNNLANWGNILPRDYNPTLYSTCFEYYPKRSVYSLQQKSGLRRDNWRNYLPLNYKDFAGKINIIKPLNATGCVILFENAEPTTFVGQDQLQSSAGVKISIGDSGLFQQNFQSLVNADDALSYGASISSRAAVNTPYGLYFVSQQIGKIFTTAGKNIEEISRTGLKFWFAENLPSKMLDVYPNFPLYDNPVAGIGVQAIYDSTYELLYFSKRDYQPLRNDLFFDDPSGVPYYICGTINPPVIPYVPPIIPPCAGCPDGSVIVDGECVVEATVPADFTGSTLTIDAASNNANYNKNGVRVYPDITAESKPLKGLISINNDNSTYRVRAANGVGSIITPLANVQNALWNASGGCGSSAKGRLNIAGVWPAGGSEPYDIDVCYSFCLEVPTTKQYCIGIAGDNEVKIYVDGILWVYLSARNLDGTENPSITVPFTSWHVFPVTLPAGTRNIRLCGINHNSVAAFAGEIYDLTLTELTTLGLLTPLTVNPACGTAAGSLDPHILFSTLDYIGEEIPVPGDSGQYVCPNGSTPIDNGCSIPSCLITEVVPGSGACPVCDLSASLICGSNVSSSSITIDYGQQITLTWATQNATNAVMNNGVGPVSLNGSLTLTPAGTMTYEILVTNANGDASICTVDVIVNPVISRCPCAFDDPKCFEPCNWTVSYDPKTKMWISFHDWHPSLMMPSYQNFYSIDDNTIWKHNDRWDSFCNYYDTDYPWEIEYPVVTPNQITTLRSFEYYLDVYKFYNDGKDYFHVLDENFDRAVIYNSEQISGVLKMRIKQKSNPLDILTNPVPGPNFIDILYSKEENKYRFNQFYDITNNRGEFSGTKLPMWNTECSGYQKYINPAYVDYFKPPLEHKKIRHYGNRVILRKSISGDNKMILKITNAKNLNSPR